MNNSTSTKFLSLLFGLLTMNVLTAISVSTVSAPNAVPDARYEVYDADSLFVVPDYVKMFTGDDIDDSYQYAQLPIAGTVIDGKADLKAGHYTDSVITITATDTLGNATELTLTLTIRIKCSIWRGGYSENFADSANWVGIWPLTKWGQLIFDKNSAAHFNPVFTGYSFKEFGGCILMPNNKLIVAGGNIYPYGPPEIKKDAELVIDGGLYNMRYNKDAYYFNNGTISVLSQKEGYQWSVFERNSSMVFAQNAGDEFTFNCWGGKASLKSMSVGDGTLNMNFKNGGLAYFSNASVITDNATNGVIKPGENSLLAYEAEGTWLSSVTLELPEMRYEVYDADSNFIVPDYAAMFAIGDSINNIQYSQTPAVGDTIVGIADLAAGSATDTTITIEATDYFGNTISMSLPLIIRNKCSIWRGGFSENFADSANWIGVWPLAQWGQIIIDKTSATDFDPVYTGYNFTQYGGFILMPSNKFNVAGGSFLPYGPPEIKKGAELVIDGGLYNMRYNKDSYYFNNGTISVLSQKEGYEWAVFERNSSMVFAQNAGDEFTFNLWGGMASLNNMSIGAGTFHLSFNDSASAYFNDSALVADILSNGVVSTLDNVFLVAEANNAKVTGATLIAPETQRGLVDREGKFEVPDYTDLVTFSQSGVNIITVAQTPAVGTLISELGEHDVVFTASDEWGNTSVAKCILDIIDYNVYCPADTTITDDNPSDSVLVPDFTLHTETAGLWQGEVTLTQFPLAGDKVALDSIFEVMITAVDTADNTSYCTFMVTVVDTTMPVLTTIDDQLLAMNEFCKAEIPDYAEIVTVTDVCYNEFTFTQTPLAGSQLNAVGDTAVVTLTVEDGNGNTSEAISFTVTAADLTEPTITKAFPDHNVTARTGCNYPLPDYTKMISATDYCASELLITQTPVGGTMLSGDGDSVVVTVRFDDQNGNIVDTTWTVTLIAEECAPKNVVFVAKAEASNDTVVSQAIEATGEYDVTVIYGSSGNGIITADDLDVLNAADVVIAGRNIGSTDLSGANDIWTAITAPVLNMNTWGLRNSRAKWFNSGASANVVSDPDTVLSAEILYDDDVFDGMTGTIDWWAGMFSVTGPVDAGNGYTLAATTDGYPLFTRWAKGVEFYDGCGQIPQGDRVYMGNGNDNTEVVYFGFTEKGQTVFFNELARMASGDPVVIPVKNSVEDAVVSTSLSVYPSPATNNITVDASQFGDDVVITITDLRGNVKMVITDLSSSTNISDLTSGIYVVKAVSATGVATTKFIKE